MSKVPRQIVLLNAQTTSRRSLSKTLISRCNVFAVLFFSGLVLADDGPSAALSFGDGSCGKLRGGIALPCGGANFEAHAVAACTLGRNFLHPLVNLTVVDSYAALAEALPTRRWQYGEMGKQAGGPLWPHKTHQNGLSADFFVPVSDVKSEAVLLKTSALNRFGYDFELTDAGELGALHIDWKAIGAHLLALEAAGKKHGVHIARIIITPDFHQQLLLENPSISHLAPLFMKKEPWVRHDEHYHVDFAIPETLRRPLKCKK
jgi:penicillin-insensitive murein DD-endopeptidase